MRLMNKIPSLPILCTALLVGCSTAANVHDPQSWTPPADTGKATSDWDVAEGICDKIASGVELTAEEKAQIEFDREMTIMAANSIADMGRQIADIGGDPSLGHISQIGAGLLPFLDAFGGASAQEDKKQKAFLKCMDRLGWEMEGGR